MPRAMRRKSASGIYHIMLRGNNRQQIFIDDEDNRRFIDCMKKAKKAGNFELYAYCIMGNHVHLLIKEDQEDIALIIKRFLCRYVFWYNKRHERSGHLFQDRYRSEAVETEAYLFTALRYIHQNPVKAGLCTQIDRYPYSSYNEYVIQPYVVDTQFILDQITLTDFKRMHSEDVTEPCLDDIQQSRIPALVWNVVKGICGCDNALDFSQADKITKRETLSALRRMGYSISQISAITGANASAVRYATAKQNGSPEQ